MRVMQAFRFGLDPDRAARGALARPGGAARFADNGGLARCREALEEGRPLPSAARLRQERNRRKRERAPGGWRGPSVRWVRTPGRGGCCPGADRDPAFRKVLPARPAGPFFDRHRPTGGGGMGGGPEG